MGTWSFYSLVLEGHMCNLYKHYSHYIIETDASLQRSEGETELYTWAGYTTLVGYVKTSKAQGHTREAVCIRGVRPRGWRIPQPVTKNNNDATEE